MTKLPTLHPYSDRTSFDRLMLLIATFVWYPGVGSRRSKTADDQDSLRSVQQQIQQMAENLGIDLPIASVHTLRKDLATLRRYSILNRNRHDWGYYLGTGAMNREEMQVALNALLSQGKYQGDAQAKRVYQTLSERLKPLNLDSKGQLFYPVRTQFNRAIVPTDPEEMIRKRQNRNTLFHQLETVEAAIVAGQAIELYQARDPYDGKTEYRQVYPLQLLYHDIAWYLLMEDCATEHLAIARIDRFTSYLKVLDATGRGLQNQHQSLAIAHQLLENGWGLHLGNLEEQRAEKQGTLPLTLVKVRFFPPVTPFIAEAECRHVTQKIHPGVKDPTTGEWQSLDYQVSLPGRSLPEFERWVRRFAHHAVILAPQELAQQHQQEAEALVQRYRVALGESSGG